MFEAAVEAVIAGDIPTLEKLLADDPGLIRARSTQKHRATLLHYVSANGVEDIRQKTPPNAVEVAKVLLDAGAVVDALADAYGRGATLGLVASSVHPLRAGVQIPLLELLLERGAAVDGPAGTWQPLIAALANGRAKAAEFLASRGAKLDLEGAAGVGRLDVVKSFFNEDGSLKSVATKEQIDSGFGWACEYGRTEVVRFLLDRGVDLRSQAHGQTGLHWAVVGGQLETIGLLLERGGPLEEKNVHGGTVLGQATWCVVHSDSGVDYVPIIETLLNAGADVQKTLYPTGNARVDELLRRHGRNL
jgi:ankyrin repeat protein